MPNLKYIDQSIRDSEEFEALKQMIQRVDRCRQAVSRKLNLADVLSDPANMSSLASTFGMEQLDVGIHLIVKVALDRYVSRTFCLQESIRGAKKIHFLYKTIGNWKTFDIVLTFHIPSANGTPAILILNPARREHWQRVSEIPAGAVISAHVKAKTPGKAASDETIAVDRIIQVFDTVQHLSDEQNELPVVLQDAAPGPVKKAKPVARKPARRPSYDAQAYASAAISGATTGEPSFSLKVTINKLDTFVHAGNAHLITTHLSGYKGQTRFYVLRGEKKAVTLDADSIWGAEIRNGETVLFEFFGPKPDADFAKELAKKVNKYTQMDKMTG